MPTRTVRFCIAQGLMDRPRGVKRGAWYEDSHLQQLLLIRRWTDAGLSLERVPELQASSPEEAPPQQVRAFIREVKLAYRRVRLVVDWKTTTTESGPV